ncbi:hypothetical protein PTTG_10153 [Puccinia triticina 1-1 BBBD Race 1]|uniref:Uncharacterized protein n=1 Tax=Puccinia triticina (isolate 1-1 / race 1 (BBBD)) TaxID=630390 RepID=A0A0C4FAB2_PUCT1|nr:hypothetical protein PTTG_10153 [Puccinia triticina 1-1 BBBD Race 1]
MGLAPNAKPHGLPSLVTSEELQSWDTWRERRKDAFSIKTRFFQWITNQGLSRVKAQVTPADVATQRKHGQYIATLRADTFLALYPARKILGHLLRDPDAVSDFEEDNANTLPQRISAHWRSPAMENIICSVDHVALKRAKTTQKKLSVKGLLARKDTRAPTAEEQIDQAIPTRFPQDAYDSNYLREEGDFQAEHLTSDAMDIDNLAKEMVEKSFGTRYCSPVNNGSAAPSAADQPAPAVRNLAGSSGPGNQTGSSGPEVQISG